MDLYAGTEVFYVPEGAKPSEKTVRWRGLVRRRSDGTVVLRCPHAHRKSMPAHKCGVKLLNEEWAKLHEERPQEPNPLA